MILGWYLLGYEVFVFLDNILAFTMSPAKLDYSSVKLWYCRIIVAI